MTGSEQNNMTPQMAPEMAPAASDAAPQAAPQPAPPETQISETQVMSVPRISVQAFCDTPDTVETLQTVAADRRLVRAHMSVQQGGIAGAVSAFATMPTPNLIIVETRQDRDTILAELARLSEVCDAGTKVIVIGHVNDVVLYRALISQGVSEYIVAPVGVLQVIDAISSLYHSPDASPVGKVLVFVGAKGGVGSSTIAHNTGWAIAEHLLQDATIVDLDLPFGTAGLNLNQDPPQGVAEALLDPDRVDDVLLDRLLTKCTDRLSLFASPGTIDRDYDVDVDAIDVVLDVTRANVPFGVVDLPHVWAPWAKRCLLRADEIVITAVPDLANLRNAKNLIDVLKATRPNDITPRLVINQIGTPKRPEIEVDDFTSALEIEPTLIIPYEPQLFGTAANNGQMIDEIAGNSKTAESFRFLAQLVTGRMDDEAPARRSLLGPLMERLHLKKG